MNIGFDAKRAFHNDTGLGEYSRNLIKSLAQNYPDQNYYLFNPKPSRSFSIKAKNTCEILPSGFLNKLFRSAWRSYRVIKDLERLKIDLYHGLSHELPLGIHKTPIKSVVTIHDLIPERHPEQYNPIDVRIYRKKLSYACTNADSIIAASEQTKKDIIEYFKIPEQKITVCYQGCAPSFGIKASTEEKKRVQMRYGLPGEFFLYVGSVIERKNLLNICKAILLNQNELNIPLVVVGKGKKYKAEVKEYIKQNRLEQKIIFISEKAGLSFVAEADMPAIYQSAVAMIYPSFFEGFGIPVLEALFSRLPVITSNVSSLPEVGGEGAYYVDPGSVNEIAAAMKKIFSDKPFADALTAKGWLHAQNFTLEKSASQVMNVYKTLCDL